VALQVTSALTFQELLFRLQTFWAERGCVLQQPYDVEVGAGTMSPETFLRVLDPRPVLRRLCPAIPPARRRALRRESQPPLQTHPVSGRAQAPAGNVQEIYLESLAAIGIDLRQHDLKFEEDNWEAPTLGAWGIGWQVMLDGLEITQFTYFQQCGGLDLDPISAEITYGLERIAAFLQDVDSLYDVVWARTPPVTYGEVRHLEEVQFSVYNFEDADVEKLWEHLRLYESECQQLLSRAAQQPEELRPGRAAPLSGSGCVRPLPQVLASLQSARCPGRDLGYRARRHHRPHPGPRRRHCQGLLADDRAGIDGCMAELLLEIGLEEIPARMIAAAQAELARRVEACSPAALAGFCRPGRHQLLHPAPAWRCASKACSPGSSTCRNSLPALPGKQPSPWAARPGGAGLRQKSRRRVTALEKITTPKGEYAAATVQRPGRAPKRFLATHCRRR
jgi:glycyl-tRNA synthetase alpha chain